MNDKSLNETKRWLGIDFSGDAAQWGPKVAAGNVWIAEIEPSGTTFLLRQLIRAQGLVQHGKPFERLVKLLAAGDFTAAAIDAPFSVPVAYLPAGGHPALMTMIGGLPLVGSQPFPRGREFVVAVTGKQPPLVPPKPLRETEIHWKKKGVNVRSTLWDGPRGGAPFAAACLTLLARAGRPLWPWVAAKGMVAEAFPAAQLRQWNLPHRGYADGGPGATAIREAILAQLSLLLSVGPFGMTLLDNDDALDATLAAFAAVAASESSVAVAPGSPAAEGEGWIAVHA